MTYKFNRQMGSSPILIIVIIIAVLALGIALWYAFTQNKNSDNSDNSQQQATVIEGTMFDAINYGQSLACDWQLNYAGPAELTQGKFYTDGVNNGRSESSYEYEEKTYEALAIINEDRTYHWSPGRGGNVQGISDDRAEYEAREPKYDLLETSIDVDLNADYTFTCQPWTVDEALFEPPSDVKFLFL